MSEWLVTLIISLSSSAVTVLLSFLTSLAITKRDEMKKFPKLKIYVDNVNGTTFFDGFSIFYSMELHKDFLIMKLNVDNCSNGSGDFYNVRLEYKSSLSKQKYATPIDIATLPKDSDIDAYLKSQNITKDNCFYDKLFLDSRTCKTVFFVFFIENYSTTYTNKFILHYKQSSLSNKCRRAKVKVNGSICRPQNCTSTQRLEDRKKYVHKTNSPKSKD